MSLQRVYTSGFTQGVQVRQQAAAGLQKQSLSLHRLFAEGVFTLGGLHRVSGLDSRQLLACKTQSLSLHIVFTEGVFTLGSLHRVSS